MSFHEAYAPAGGGTRLRTGGLAVQRQCACGNHAGGGECEACRRKRLLQRKDRGTAVPTPSASRFAAGFGAGLGSVRTREPAAAAALHTAPLVQRQGEGEAVPFPAESTPVPEPAAAPSPGAVPEPSPQASPEASPEESAEAAPAAPAAEQSSTLIVDDDSAGVLAGQMRKTEFLNQLQSTVCAQADAVLAASGRSSEGCPYLAGWFGYYRGQSASHVESALRRYAPETRGARSAAEYIPIVAARVREGVQRWATTGEITGVPEGLPTSIPGFSGIAGALGALGGMLFKAKEGGPRPADDPAAVQQSLGPGHPLESGVRGRMERAFGQSFAHVRTHTDSTARQVSAQQNARAFTVGRDVAFGTGEYRPGTPVGDALIAHELAHVVQQDGAAPGTQAKPASGGASYGALERDADDAAVGAVASLWGGARGGLAGLARGGSLKSGLRLQRCKSDVATCSAGTKTIAVDFVRLAGATGNPATDLAAANTVFSPCCVQFTQGSAPPPESLATTQSWLGGDDDLSLNGITCGSTPAEEKTLYDSATAAHSLGSRMRVFYVKTYTGYTGAGFSRPPYCAAGYANHVVLQNSSSGATNPLAHEFGHILLDSGTHGTAPNLMGTTGGSVLDATQCRTIYNNA